MFLSQEAFATVVQSTPLISIDLIVENAQGEFLLGKRNNRPAQGTGLCRAVGYRKMKRWNRRLPA